jgi:hypothetical protein
MPASQKLSHLLKLADQGPALRAALAEEVAELLTQWPSDYPESMRAICESLLAKAAHDVDTPTRARLRVRLYADPELSARVLPRETPAHLLLDAVRDADDLESRLAENLGLDAAMARQVLDDDTGMALAAACKGANINRATFSAIILLAKPGRDRSTAYAALDAFDAVPVSEATRLLRGWRDESEAHAA